MSIAAARGPVRNPDSGTRASAPGRESVQRLLAVGRRALPALAAGVFLAGCGGSLSRDTRSGIGRATLTDIELNVPQVLADHGYSVSQRRQTGRRIYYETSWLYREPFEDEADRGVEDVRTRFIVQGRRGGSDFYDVEIKAENFVRGVSPSAEWTPLSSPDFQEHVRSVSDELIMNMNAGVRTR